jgi:D-apionolactonase
VRRTEELEGQARLEQRMIPSRVLQCGVDRPQPERTELRAGPLRLIYEAGEIRYVRLENREIVRRIYVTLRDGNWATLLPSITNLEINSLADSFELSFDAEHCENGVDFMWRAKVSGNQDGTVAFRMNGECRSTFLQSRMGFCVLHPLPELAGRRCTVEHPDRTTDEQEFPYHVSPHQPFTDIYALKHEVVAGVEATIQFQGGVFEIEDQRNWTDGSFKSYSPPLSVPYPTTVTPETRISQTVTISTSGTARKTAACSPTPASLTVASDTLGKIPRIGLGFANGSEPLEQKQLERLARLNLNHLRVDLKLWEREYRSVLQRAWSDAASLDVPLEVAIFLSADESHELEDVAVTVDNLGANVFRWLVFRDGEESTGSETLRMARQFLRRENGVEVGGGSDANFAALNRARPSPDDLDVICYPANPQVHLSDNSTLIEALEGQASTVISAKQWAGGRPIAISPVTLKPRSNSAENQDSLPADVDPRQRSLFGAAWTLGSLKYLAESGADSVTYFETHGRRGLQLGGNITGDSIPYSKPDSVFPLYHVLADVGEFAGAKVLRVTSSDPLRVIALALVKNGVVRLMCANFTADKEIVEVNGLKGKSKTRWLSETEAEYAMSEPEAYRSQTSGWISPSEEFKLEIPAYAIACVDVEVGE